MNRYIDAGKLIAEIESRMEDCKLPNGKFPTTTNAVRYEELSCLRNFITSLQQEMELPEKYQTPDWLFEKQEQPELPGIEEPGIPGKDFIPVEWVEACQRYGKWRIVKHEQSQVADASKMEQSEAYNHAMLEVKAYVDKLYDNTSIGLNEYDIGLYNGIIDTCMKLRGFIKTRISMDQPEVDLVEEITRFFSKNPIPHEHITDWPLLKNTAIHFYELGRLNARKEE